MKLRKLLRIVIIALTGMLFAAYAAYNVFIIFRDGVDLNTGEIVISALVALLFAVFALFVWTAGLSSKNHRLLTLRMIRRTLFILALIAVFLMKLRMVDKVISYMDFSKLHTVLYGASYFLTQAALLILLIYYAFIRNKISFFPVASVLLPVIAMLMFLYSFVLEILLFFMFKVSLEASPLRTVLIRPVFYLGFIGLSAGFLFPRLRKSSEDAPTA